MFKRDTRRSDPTAAFLVISPLDLCVLIELLYWGTCLKALQQYYSIKD